jgi:hypothetical protein
MIRAHSLRVGTCVYVMLMEDQPEESPFQGSAIPFSTSRFREFHLKPLTQIARIEVATDEKPTIPVGVIHEDRRYMGHVNTSPALPEILTYCHEGPWNWIDQRIWGLNVLTGETWKVRPQEGDYSIGHEYWFADGIHGDRSGRLATTGGRGTSRGGTCLGTSAGTMRNGWRTISPSTRRTFTAWTRR